MASKDQKVEPPKAPDANAPAHKEGMDAESLMDFSELKPGEYSIHVYVERTRCLTHPDNPTELVDPMIGIHSLGKKQYTQVKKKVGPNDKFWGEHLYIEKNIANKEEIKNGKLLIEVIDYNTVSKNCLIGNYEMDLATIYFEKEHTMKYKWLALTNVKKNYSKIMGYIKVSVSVHRAGEKQVLLTEEPPKKTSLEKGASENQVLLPPQLQQKPGQLVFKLFKAEALKKMDTLYSIDAYCVLECGGFSLKSETVMDNKNPQWYKELWLPLFQPTVNENLTLKLWDYDRGSDDELVGCCNFSLKQIQEGELSDPFWCNVYGSPYDCSYKEEMNTMNNNPQLGTYWCGRILCAISYQDVEEPQCIIKPMSKEDVENYKFNDEINYGITVDAFYGLQLPDNKKYSLTVRWADQLVQTKKIEAKNNLIEWFERVKLDCSLPYRSSDTLPDVFIYLTDSDGKCVSYVREKAKKFMIATSMAPKNYFLIPDKSMSKIRSDEAGVLNATVIIEIEGCSNQPNPLLEQAKKQQPKKTMLNVNLYQCQDLIPGDSNGTSDPYCEVYFYGNLIKFPAKNDTNNPIWYKNQQILVSQYNETNPPPILIRFFDEDTVSSDFLGSALVEIADGIKEGYIGKNKNDIINPHWVDLKFNRNSTCGRVLISMFFDDSNVSKPSIYDLRPKLEKYRIQVKVLGLRNLKSYGPMPVRRPYIKFDINSLKGIGESKNASKNLYTEPKGFGPNPTISTIIKFDCLLPEDLTLMPSLSCTVYDKILFGLIQPIIGQFSINLKEFVMKTRERQAQKFKKTTTFAGDISSMMLSGKVGSQMPPSSTTGERSGSNEISINDESKLKQALLQGVQEQEIEDEKIEDGQHEPVLEGEKLKKEEKEDDEHVCKIDKYEIYDETKKVFNQKGQIQKDYTLFWAHYSYDKSTGEIVENNPPDSNCYYALSFDNRINKMNSIRIKETNQPLPVEQTEATGLVKEGEVVNYVMNNQVRKHYRYIVHTPLEQSIFIENNVFDIIEVNQCKRFNESDMYNDMVLSHGNVNQAGKFKGIISVVPHSDTKLFESVQSDKQEERDKDFMSQKYVLVRLYVLEAINIPNADEVDESDPYLIVKLGSQKISTRKRFVKDNSAPIFNEMFEFKTALPGDSLMKIQLWDYDELSADDFLCETTIDLEDRFYSKRWRKLINPPIETRPLFHPSSSLQKGDLRLWVEIIPGTEYERVKSIYHISHKPTQEFELRCVVWGVSDIPAQDIEDTSDLFVMARVGNLSKQTDVHFRSQNGEGNFNWRMKFPVTLPTKDPTIHFQVFDKDIFSPDDFISSVSINFEREAIAAFENDRRIKMYGSKNLDATVKLLQASNKKYDKIEFPMSNVKKSDSYKLQFKQEGKIVISFELVPKSEADHDPVGNGRSDPNHSPHLPAPAGRFKWSWNPYTLFCQMVGPKMRAKVCFLLCLVLCCFIFVMTLPAIIGQAIEDELSGEHN